MAVDTPKSRHIVDKRLALIVQIASRLELGVLAIALS
jgi:hypothetical protein